MPGMCKCTDSRSLEMVRSSRTPEPSSNAHRNASRPAVPQALSWSVVLWYSTLNAGAGLPETWAKSARAQLVMPSRYSSWSEVFAAAHSPGCYLNSGVDTAPNPCLLMGGPPLPVIIPIRAFDAAVISRFILFSPDGAGHSDTGVQAVLPAAALAPPACPCAGSLGRDMLSA